ncbi:MAG: cytochrome c biogenesis CcdA family protein [Egibacteraceae bacterium]
MRNAVPLSLALVAGGLATFNPCSLPLLPAFLSFSIGAESSERPAAESSVARALLAGLLITGGFLGVFAIVALPVTAGFSLIADALPWAGVAVGLVLLAVGLLALCGVRVRVPVANLAGPGPDSGHGRRTTRMLLFGAGYGVASFGCTFPVFLTLLGAVAAAGGGGVAMLAVFAAYALGAAIVLMALAVAATRVAQGLGRRFGLVLTHVHRLSGGLLVISGAYLTYYWLRVQLGPASTLASDPLVGTVTRFSAGIAVYARGAGLFVVVFAGLIVVLAVVSSRWQSSRARSWKETARER